MKQAHRDNALIHSFGSNIGSLFRVDEPVTVILYITGRRHKVQMGTTIIPTHTNPFSRGS